MADKTQDIHEADLGTSPSRLGTSSSGASGRRAGRALPGGGLGRDPRAQIECRLRRRLLPQALSGGTSPFGSESDER